MSTARDEAAPPEVAPLESGHAEAAARAAAGAGHAGAAHAGAAHAGSTRAPAPPRLVEPSGLVHTGWFDAPVLDPNLEQAPAAHALSGLRDTPLAWLERGARAWRMKRWHYTSVVTDNVLFACAVVDVGYLGNAFAYVVDRKTGKKHEYSTLTPTAAGVTIAKSSIDGASRIRWPGFGRIELGYDARDKERTIEVALDGTRGPFARPSLSASYRIRDAGTLPAPIVVVEETEPGRWLYTHKCYGLEAKGAVRAGDIVDDGSSGSGLAGLDWNKGFRPRETHWNWAAASGRSRTGAVVGFNLTAHRKPGERVNHAGDDATDCALWVDGRVRKLERVQFEYDRARLLEPWRIYDEDGKVELRFHPAGERAEDVNLAVVVSRFHQPYGRFEGTLEDANGTLHVLDNVYGVVEQHFARW